MYLIERVSNNIAGKIAATLKLDKEQEAVLAYGAFGLLETILAIILVLVFGKIFGVLLEAIIISFVSAIFRKYSGGAHATSPNRCAAIGVIVSVGLGIFVNKISINIFSLLIFGLLTFFIVLYITVKYAPVDTPNKPIKKLERRKKLKIKSLIILFLFLIITLILTRYYIKLGDVSLLSIIASILLGLLWQAITLTSLGHLIIHKLDDSLRKIATLGGRGI
ncbi:accessory regulator AgrB [Crassaminicella thermophila]|uniref:Accessory regulator AgrB n=1 Tax=Crassaminicella thermophila TaxID=2599308 RepID=A0A5C0S9L7_CRATE|nr:accessory gene regulator B family protein [Crassaminicella thermophila]QEK11243.1 accessory regulator AgrB [Crassaminicella thermophila]